MSAMRRLASRLIAVSTRAPKAELGMAMLRKWMSIEDDWPALCWALGSTTRVRTVPEGLSPEVAGARLRLRIASAILIVCILALWGLIRASWFADGEVAERLAVVVVPEAIYLVSAAALWRQRKSLAVGILAAGFILITHVIVHFTAHG
jgi:hypothetical protein